MKKLLKTTRSPHPLLKLDLKMKLSALFIVTALFTIQANTSYSQKTKVSLDLEDVSVERLLDEIENSTDFKFVYKTEDVDLHRTISINVKKERIGIVLDRIFGQTKTAYNVVDRQILLTKKSSSKESDNDGAEVQQDIRITGTVTDVDGTPLPGVTVQVKGTRRGTACDFNGKYIISVPDQNTVLVFTSMGYAAQEIVVGQRTTINVQLEEAVNQLDEVTVNAGYYNTTEKLRTGNIVTVKAEEIEKQPVMNPLQALQGRVTGLDINQTSGYTSAPFKVEIRGRSSIDRFAVGEPLFIIDGVPLTILNLPGSTSTYETGSTGFIQNGFTLNSVQGQSPFYNLNPEDIESISVLKDADAVAIYGSRGANGVILITTKKGKQGKSEISIKLDQGVSVVTSFYDMLNTQEYLEMRREAFENDGIEMTPGNAYDILVWDNDRYTDWQKEIWGNMGTSTDLQLSLSGGSEQTTYRIGGGYRHQKGITAISGSDQRGSLSFNLAHTSSDRKFNASLSNSYTFTQADIIEIRSAPTLAPNAPPFFDEDGKPNFAEYQISNSFPFQGLLNPYVSKTGFLNSSLSVNYKVIKSLSLGTKVGYGTMENSQHRKIPITSLNPLGNPTGSAFFGSNNLRNWIIEPNLTFKTPLGVGKLEFLLGGTLQGVESTGQYIYATGYVNDNLLSSASNAPNTQVTDAAGNYKYSAIYSRLNYNIRDKYIVNVTARRDGSSRFGPDRRFGNFGAVGVGWIFSEEGFFKSKLPFLSFGKLRLNYGITGLDEIKDYQYLTRWSANGITPYQGVISYVPSQHANPEYRWQEDFKLEGALEISLVDRLDLSVAYYRNRTGNQLLPQRLPAITGFPEVTQNLDALVQNSGLEFAMNSSLVDKTDVSLTVNFNISFNRNKLLEYDDLASSPNAGRYFVGEPLNTRRLLNYNGVDPSTGLYSFEDKNNDGVIEAPGTDSDGNLTGDFFFYDLSPKYLGGCGANFTYKGLDLSVYFNFKKQIGRNAFTSGTYPGKVRQNQSVEVLDRWQQVGDNTEYPRFSTNDQNIQIFQISTGSYTDASFVRLQNLSLGYTLPKEVFGNFMDSFRIYVQGQNLLLFTKYKGTDPETQNFSIMPPALNLITGIQLTF